MKLGRFIGLEGFTGQAPVSSENSWVRKPGAGGVGVQVPGDAV